MKDKSEKTGTTVISTRIPTDLYNRLKEANPDRKLNEYFQNIITEKLGDKNFEIIWRLRKVLEHEETISGISEEDAKLWAEIRELLGEVK